MAFTGMGQILSSRMVTRVQQSVNVYNAKIADIQVRIDNLKRFRSYLPGYLEQARILETQIAESQAAGGMW